MSKTKLPRDGVREGGILHPEPSQRTFCQSEYGKRTNEYAYEGYGGGERGSGGRHASSYDRVNP